jgi:transposase-like protein
VATFLQGRRRFKTHYRKKKRKMAEDHRKLAEEVSQGVLLDDPGFLEEIVERVLQELLEAQMTEHLRAAPYERTENREGRRNGYKPRALSTPNKTGWRVG